MPMDYDDSEFSIHNVELTEEGSSTVSPVLRPYDYEDGGHLSFDSLVENEVFLGITGQEDNQWIEEYSRGTSSSAAESRHDNVWSEAASSETVEMLLKSVGQGTLVTESSDGPGSLATNMDPNLKQYDESNDAQEAMISNKEEEGALAAEELDMDDEPGSLSINMEPNLKQEDENNHALEAMVANKEEEGALATEELHVSDEPGSISLNLDPKLKQEDENNHALKAMVTDKEEEGVLATEELDVSDEPGSLSINMDPNLTQDDANNHAQEAMVIDKEVGALVTEELDASDEPGSLAIHMDHSLKQDDGNNHVQEAMVIDKEVGALVTEELDASDEPGSLAINMDPNLKQDDGNNHVQEAMVINKEVGALVTEELDANDEPGSLSINMDSNLKQDDENNHAQEAMVTDKEVGALVTEELDASDEPGSLAINMDPNLRQDDGNSHAHEAMIINKPQDHFTGSNASFDCDKFYVTVFQDSQEETEVSGGELDSDVLGNTCDLSEENVDGTCDDVNHEARNIAAELSENKLQEDLSTTKIECGNLDASEKCNLKRCSSKNEAESSTKNTDNPIGSHTAVETCTNSDEKPSNVDSLDKPPFAVDILVDEEPMPAGSCSLLMTAACAEGSHDSKCAATAFPEAHELNNDLMHEEVPPVTVEDDDKTKSVNLASLESNVCPPSKLSDAQSRYLEESEKPDSVFDLSEMGEGSNINDAGTNMTNTCSSAELIAGNTDLVATPKVHSGDSNKDQSPAAKLSGSVQQQVHDEIQSSEQDGGTCIDHSVTFHEEGNARLPLDTDIAALDSQKNAESVSSAEGCKAQESEADITILAEPGYIDVKYPILGGASSVHHDNEKKEEGFNSDCENESLKVASSMVDCASLSVIEIGASPDSAGEVVHETSDESVDAVMSDLAEEANPDGLGACSTPSTVDPTPCDSSAKVGDSIEAGGGMQESISGHHVNMSCEQHASTDVVLTSEYNNSHMRNDEDSSISMDKLESVSPLLNANTTELSQSIRVKPSQGAINEISSSPEETEDVVLISECDDSHMRHEEDSSVSMDKLQSVSPLSNTNNAELSRSTRVEPSEGDISENTSLPEATEGVVPISECDNSHMKHEEDCSVSMDKLESVSPLLNRNGTELFQSTRVSEGAINENTSFPEATEDAVLTSECDDTHMRHEEDGSVSVDKLQSVSPLLNTDNTELSQSTRVKPSEGTVNENASLPEAAEDVVLTSECDDNHTRHGEDSSVSMDKIQSVSPLLNTNNTDLSQSTKIKPIEGAINENTSLPEAIEDLMLTSECDERREEDSSVSMDKLESVSPLLNTNNTDLSQSTIARPIEGAINEDTSLPEAAEDVVLTSESDCSHTRHEGDTSVSMGKLQPTPLLNTNNTEFSQSTRVKPSEGAVNENTSLPEATEDVQGKEQSIYSNSDMKIDQSFTFEVSASATDGLRETCKGLQLFPASQACNVSTTMEVPCIDSSSSALDPRKPNETSGVTPQTPGSGIIHTGAKERKTRRKSVGKESVKKGKETTTIRSGRVEKSSPLLVTPPQPAAAGQAIQFQDLVPKEKVECSVTKPSPISNLPDLNNAACIFHQPFTNNQQGQLRAQILVYGSLISGMPPEEPHMIAAFGQSDAGRKTWEDAWHACLERAHGQKSQANTPMQQPRADLKDVGYRSPDLGIKHSSILSSTNKGTPPAVSPLIPISSPLWNMSTPSCVGFQSRNAAFQHPFTPIHHPSYQTPHNPLWLSQSPFLGQWGVASSPGSVAPRFSALPITEAVKLTPVNASGGGPHTYSIPVVHSTLFSSPSTDDKKVSSGSKSRKRKKVSPAVSSVPSQVLTPPSAHLIPRTGGHTRIPFLVEDQTDSVTAPVVTSIFSTSVTVSAPPASKSSSPGRFLAVHDRPRLGDKKVGNAEDMLLKNIEEGNLQEADANATKTWQLSSDSRSTQRKKVSTSPAVNLTPVSMQASPAVTYLPQVLGSEILSLAQNQTISVTTAFCTSFPTSVAMSTPVSITSESSPAGRFSETIYPTSSTHGYPRTGYQNMENALVVEETLSKVEESKLQAENAALLAAAEVSNCQDVWSGLGNQRNSGVVSDAEAKLISSIAAAATVAKMASAAAKIASNVAEQAKLMADEVFVSSKTANFNHISHPNVVNKATPASILKSLDKTTDSHPNSIISAAREAARRRIEAASAASKHAENLDAIVKAAELAAEAVSQVGKIAAMSDSSALRKLAEAGPEGFWKISQLAYEQHQGGEISGLHLNSNSGKKKVPDGQSPPVHMAHNQMKTVINDGSFISNEKGTRTPKVPYLSKAVGVSTETNTRSPHTYVVGHHIPQKTPGVWEEHGIKEGCFIEVYKENGKYKGAWLAANVLSLKDEKALVCYTGIRSSDEEPENIKEWVAFEVEGSEEVPRIRIAHPTTTMGFEGARKRRRTAVTDYAWSKGDRVDVWMQDCWREGIVLEQNKLDATSLTVQFPAVQGETSVRSWHVRPTLIWKDRRWIECNGGHASQGETPKEKRMKLGSPAAVVDKRKDKLPMIVESGRHKEQGTVLPLLSAQESCFNVGKSTNKPSSNLTTIHKERARVVFGVPKPGKKQKFMAVSTQYVDDRSDKSNTTNSSNSSFKFSKPSGARVSKNDAIESQVTETKSKLKPRKPPVPWFRTTTNRDPEPTDADSVENSSSRQNQTQVGSSSNKRREPAKGPPPKKAFTFTSKPKTEHFNRGRPQPPPKIEVKDKSDSQVNEPRRSNRKIQPTSRLLEGLQSSLTISKIPSISNHASQRKVTSKGNN